MTTVFDMSYATLYDEMTAFMPTYPNLINSLEAELQQKLKDYNLTLPQLFRELAIK